MINPVPHNEISFVEDIVKQAILHMLEMGIDQWDELYPSRQIFEDDINNGWLYGYYEGAELCGCIVLNNVQSPEYADITWKRPDANPLVIHRMCVAPSWQGKGIAKQLLSFAESFASANNHSSIRLDAFIHNPLATRLYIRNDYEKRGQVRFRKGEFYCFEKIIC